MNRTKTYIAYILLVAMIFSVFPKQVFANFQGPVADIMLQHIPGQGTDYRLRVSWTSGVPSNRTDTGANDSSVIHTPEGYDVYMRNATLNGVERIIHTEPARANDYGGNQYQVEQNFQLDRGSLYFYGVRPYHFHTYNGPNGTTELRRAPIDLTVFHPQAIFMTDIQVDATGEGNSLTITWDNPTYDNGKPLDYLISYSPGGAEVTNFKNSVIVPGTSATVVADPNRNGTRLRTVISNPTEIVPGTRYTVKVEPLVNGQTLSYYRNRNEIPRLSIGNNLYPFVTSGREYRNNQAFTYIPLEIYEDGGRYIRLNWWGLNEGSTATTKIRSLQIVKSTSIQNPGSDSQVVATLYSQDAYRIGNYRVLKPTNTESTVYRIQVFYEGNNTANPDMISKWVIYDPTDVKVTPNKPEIRKVVPIVQTGTQNNSLYRLEITWDAFVHPPYTDKEEQMKRTDGTYLDRDVVYDVWITDGLEHLYNRTVPPVHTDLSTSGLETVITAVDGKNVDGYKRLFQQYVKVNQDGTYQLNAPIEPNKLYYIQIVAKKKVDFVSSNIKDELLSEPAYSSIYFSPDGNVYVPPMISKPPLKIRRDGEGKEMITENSAVVEWRNRWVEIYNPETKQWYSKVKEENGELLFDFEGEGIELKSEDDLQKLTVTDYIHRATELDENTRYEVKVVPYTEIEDEMRKGTYTDLKQYIESIPETGWNQASYIIDPNDQTKRTLYYTIQDRQPNTAYVVFLRAYRTLPTGQKITAAYPSYLLFTTLATEDPLYPTPTVPQLSLVSAEDMALTVKWNAINAFSYEIRYSEKEEEDPGKGILIGSAELGSAPNDGEFKRWRIQNLFPETEYYIWIRAIQQAPGGTLYSEWSVPVHARTTDIPTPMPPDGIGLASKESLKIINDKQNTKYEPVEDHYLIIEWLKNIEDKSVDTGAGQGTAGEAYEILSDELIKLTRLVKFNNLIANRPYYIRVKTKVTVQKQGNEVVKTYSYVIQLADNDEFIDGVEVEVPTSTGSGNGTGAVKQKESVYSTTLRIITRPNQSEYDGDVDADTVLLPGEDYELIYDGGTRTLTYRFRSSEKDQQGNKDNRVEQRLITALVQKKAFTLTVNMEKYQDKSISHRVVEIPYTLWMALEERKISFKILTDNMSMTFGAKAFAIPVFQNAPGKGDGSKIRIQISTGIGRLPYPQPMEQYETLVVPKQLQVFLQTARGTFTAGYMGAPVQYQMKLRSRYELSEKQVDGYIYDNGTGKWIRANAEYDQQNGEMVFATDRLSAYGVYGVNGPTGILTNHWTNEGMRAVTAKYNIADLDRGAYNPNQTLTVNQAVNLIGGIAMKKKDIYMNGALTATELQQLTRAGLRINGVSGNAQVNREDVIPLLVKLYELGAGYPISVDSSYRNQIKDYTTVTAKNQTAILKAKQAGLLGSGEYVYPKRAITIGELFYMLDIVIQDTGV